MSYNYYVLTSQFRIDQDKIDPAREAVAQDYPDSSEGESLDNLIKRYGWRLFFEEYDQNCRGVGNVIGICKDRLDMGNCSYMFEMLAPFVRPGSFIEAIGEDGQRWRWVFDGECTKLPIDFTVDEKDRPVLPRIVERYGGEVQHVGQDQIVVLYEDPESGEPFEHHYQTGQFLGSVLPTKGDNVNFEVQVVFFPPKEEETRKDLAEELFRENDEEEIPPESVHEGPLEI